jgi:hypothetical protein
MLSLSSNRARRDQAEDAIDRLDADIQAWLRHRRDRDARGQHRSQLDAVEALVSGGAARLRQAVRLVDLGQPSGDLFDECRLHELRILWLARVWYYFRDKFDQRDDPLVGPVLEAADDVVWSCHQPIYRQAADWAPDVKNGPAPLPYIEPWYSPQAFPAELVPADLRSEVDVGFLREFLNRLPIPVVRLQPACITAPWWLIYLGHEVGHHIQFGILPEMGLVDRFREAVGAAVLSHGGSDEDAARWRRWSPEIFADLFALLMLGDRFVWAMVELELQAADAMFARRPAYPSAAVRLWLLAQAASRLGLDAEDALRGLVPDSAGAAADAKEDLTFAGSVVEAALGPIPGLPVSLTGLCSFRAQEHEPGGAVDRWRDLLADGGAIPPERNIRSSRLVTSGAVAAWADMIATDEKTAEQRVARRKALAARTVQAIKDNAEPGTRARVEAPTVDGGEIANLLLKAGPRQLGG